MTREEREAIAVLDRLAKTWPSNLWIFAADGQLHVMRKYLGRRRMAGDGYDEKAVVASIPIEADGGDW